MLIFFSKLQRVLTLSDSSALANLSRVNLPLKVNLYNKLPPDSNANFCNV